MCFFFFLNVDILPKNQPYDCIIELRDKTQPLFGLIHNLLQNKLKTLKNYIHKNLTKNFIQQSRFPTSVLILYIKKKDILINNIF